MANKMTIPRPLLSLPEVKVSWKPRIRSPWRLFFRIVTAPFWVGSGMPSPRLLPRDRPLPSGGLAGDQVGRCLDGLARRIWIQRTLTVLFRTAWLPILVSCGWLIWEILGGPRFRTSALPWVIGVLVAAVIWFVALIRPTRFEIARMLDRTFRLQDRMVTACENIGRQVPNADEPAPVVYLQMAEAANTVTALRGAPALRIQPPVREVVLAIAAALLLAALYFLRGVGGGIPGLSESSVPRYTPAVERLAAERAPEPGKNPPGDAPTRSEIQAEAARSSQAQQDLKQLADALSDQAVTRSAAEAIQRGDYAGAADLIREAAQSADEMSQTARESLASDLDAAAAQMSPGSEELAGATRDAADGLRQGGEPATGGMDGLADAVDNTASDIVSQRELAAKMREADAAAAASGQGDPAASETGAESGASDSLTEANDSTGSASGDSGSESPPGDPGASSGAEAAAPQDDDTGSADAGDAQAATGDTSNQDTGGSAQQDGNAPGNNAGQQQTGATQPGQGTQPGETASGESIGENTQQGGEGAAGNPGSGAGGESQIGEPGTSSTGDPTGSNTGGSGPASDPSLTEATQGSGNGDDATVDPRIAVSLARSPGAGGVQTSSSGGAATSGSGGGAAAAGGSGEQATIGEAGPDSNRVPAEYREIVERYFTDPDGS